MSAAEGATPKADRQPLRSSCGFPPGDPPFGDREFRWEENPERVKASAHTPSGSLASRLAAPTASSPQIASLPAFSHSGSRNPIWRREIKVGREVTQRGVGP